MFSVDSLFDACALRRQLFLEPLHHRSHCWILLTQTLGNLNYK